jgi:Glutaminase
MPGISLQRARQMFDLVNAKLCCASVSASPCIPFSYPDDGCWGRAHEMCRLMLAAGEQPRKVWIRRNNNQLHVDTTNHPDCFVEWNWHVAPTLVVATGTGDQTYVVDPALFNEPVPQATWVSIQNSPNPTLTPTGPEVFHQFTIPPSLDPTYSHTNNVLEDYRIQLRLRSASNGPPPYTNCMVKGPGVQWFGIIGPNQTRRWFSWGWPAKWHVLWTVVPLTPCVGGPQLNCKVALERADNTNCTYWISVRNLTGASIRFEGRYDILSY